MGICNFCSLKEWRARARKVGLSVKTFPDGGWQRAYEYPCGIDIDALSREEREQYASGTHYLEVGVSCDC